MVVPQDGKVELSLQIKLAPKIQNQFRRPSFFEGFRDCRLEPDGEVGIEANEVYPGNRFYRINHPPDFHL